MRRTLEIQEILLNIFGHCYPLQQPEIGSRRDVSCLAVLARTCRTFKEPALDVLWENLDSFSPLFRCLPEASRKSSQDKYSFIRPLTETEWHTLRSYTCRIRSLQDLSSTLKEKSFLNPLTTEPLFPNLRSLSCEYKAETILLLQLPLPHLTSLKLGCTDVRLIWDNLNSLPTLSPNIKSLSMLTYGWQDPLDCKVVPDYFCQWKNLETLICYDMVLDMDSVVNLSRVPTLTHLAFTLINILPTSIPTLHFENVQELSLFCDSLVPLSRLLSQTQLPVLSSFSAYIGRSSLGQALDSFFFIVQTANRPHTIETLSFFWGLATTGRSFDAPEIVLNDLRPCISFNHLRRLCIDIEWKVGLTDDDLLALVSAWPRLEELCINKTWGWGVRGGITPNGLLQLLQTRRSLNRVTLAIDTRGDIPQLPEGFGSTLPPTFSINVVDSYIALGVVPAMAAFFAPFASDCDFSLVAWNTWNMMDDDEWEVHRGRWDEVYTLDDGTPG